MNSTKEKLFSISVVLSDVADLLHELADEEQKEDFHNKAVQINQLSFYLYSKSLDEKQEELKR